MSANMSTTGTARRRPHLRNGLILLFIGGALGFWGGISAAKKAMTSPIWVQNIFGIPQRPAPVSLPLNSPMASMTPVQPVIPPQNNPASNPPLSSGIPTSSGNPTSASPRSSGMPVSENPPTEQTIIGKWEITDKKAAPPGSSKTAFPVKVTSTYLFDAEGVGEFSSNGKKLYDIHWKHEGDDILITYDAPNPETGKDWNVKLKWLLSEDASYLTLIPQNGKDARNVLWASGPGMYHRVN